MCSFQGVHQSINDFWIEPLVHLAFTVLKDKVFGLHTGQTYGRTCTASQAGKNSLFRITTQFQFVLYGETGNPVPSPWGIGFCLLY
jgi:hypothetical protein